MKRSLKVKGDALTRLRGMLGFAARAGRIIFGAEQTAAELRKKAFGVKIVLVAQDASDGTKKKIRTKCEFYRVPLLEIPLSKDELGSLLGKSYAPSAAAISDEGFAREIAAAIPSTSENETKE